MLVVEFLNDKTGSDEAANYRVRVTVNGREIATTTVKGHPRADHWTGLLARCAAQNYPAPTESRDHRSNEPCAIYSGPIAGTFYCDTHGTVGAGYDLPPASCFAFHADGGNQIHRNRPVNADRPSQETR